MAFYTASGKALATAAATNIIEVRAASTDRARIYEIGVFAETAVALNLALFPTSVIGTAGTAVVPAKHDQAAGASAISVVTGPSGGTLGAVAQRRGFIPAVVGAGLIWTFNSDMGIVVPLSGSVMLRNDGAAVGPAVTWYITFED